MSVNKNDDSCLDSIDGKGYRANVGIIIMNKKGNLFWAKRCKKNFWQFPQGGINIGETPEEAMWRELKEEVDLCKESAKYIAQTSNWLYYKIPKNFVRKDGEITCIGQKQKWFLLLLNCKEQEIRFDKTNHPEFDDYEFVSYWYPIRKVVGFKRKVYRKALLELSPFAQKIMQKLKNGESI